MCDCPQALAIETGWGLTICGRCGTSVSAPISNVVCHPVPSPTRPPYSKHKRFAKLLANTYGNRCSKIHAELIDKLAESNIRTSQDIYNVIRKSKGQHMKRYDALARLTCHTLGTYVQPLSHHQNTWATFTFREVVSRHAFRRGTFPAYSWCIEKILIAIGRQDLLEYVHALKCKKRRHVYEETYGDLFRIPSSNSGNPIGHRS